MNAEEYKIIKEKLDWLKVDTLRYFNDRFDKFDALEDRLGIRTQYYGVRINPFAEDSKANFNPSQPRVPAGNPDGGQWSDSGGSGYRRNRTTDKPERYSLEDVPDFYDDTIEPVYPIETVLGALTVGRALPGIMTAVNFWKTGQRIHKNPGSKEIIDSIEKFLGGKPDRTFRNKNDDLIITKGDKKIRFDINNPHPHEEPHFHIQEKTSEGWKNIGKQRFSFKEK